MPLWIVRNDITRMRVDAIVNAAKPSLLGGGGVDGAIHAAAGPELAEACKALGGCPVGGVRLTPGFRLPCRWVIHTVGPVWQGGDAGEWDQLQSCYRSALELAESLGCESLAFPLIASGAYGTPKDLAAEAARQAIESFLWKHEMTVYLVLYGEESLTASRQIFDQIREYIDNSYVQEHPSRPNRRRRVGLEDTSSSIGALPVPESMPLPMQQARRKEKTAKPASPAAFLREEDKIAAAERSEEGGFDSRFGRPDESFQQMLLRKIDERGMTDAACYKRANIDRKLFSKIRKDVYYKPSKPTALAFAVALELDLGETEELLEKAGFALSRSSRFDLILRWFIEREIYDVFRINEALFEFDQPLLGNLS